MPLQTSGPISLSNVGSEFQNSAPYSMSEFYGAAAGIPASGAIGLSNFYGATAAKIDTIIIPASETGYQFIGDTKNTGPERFRNLAFTRYVTSTAYPLQYGTMYTKYSSYAAELGYSSILVEVNPLFLEMGDTYGYCTNAVIYLTHLAPNTAVSSQVLGDQDTLIVTNGNYAKAGRDLIKNIKVTKAGTTVNLGVCQFDTAPTYTDALSTLWPIPFWTPYALTYADPPSFYIPVAYYVADGYPSGDFPVNFASGQQQWSVEIEWV